MAEVPRSGHHGSKLHLSHAGDPQPSEASERILPDLGTSAVAMATADKEGGPVWTEDTLLPKVTQQLRTLYPWCEDMPLQFETLAKQQTKLMLRELYADSTVNIRGNTGLCDSHPTSDITLDFGQSPDVQTQEPASLNVKTRETATHHVKGRVFKEAASLTSTISKMQPPQCQNNSCGSQPSTPDTCYQSHVTVQYASRLFQGMDVLSLESSDPWGLPPKPPPGITSAQVEEPVLPNDSCCSKLRKLSLDKANVKSVRPPLKPPLGTKMLPTKQPRSPITESASSVTTAKPSSSRKDCQPSSVTTSTGAMANTHPLRASCGNNKTVVSENSQPRGRPKANKPSFPVKSDSVGRHRQQGPVTDKKIKIKRQDNLSPVVVEDWEDEIEEFPAGFMGNYQPHKLKLFQSRDKTEENLGESKPKGIPGLVVNAPQKQASGRSRKSSREEEQPEGKTQMKNAATKERCLQDGSNGQHKQQWVKIGKQGKQKKKAQRKEKL